MKKICILLGIVLFSLSPLFSEAKNCDYNGDDPIASFRNCSPTGVIKAENNGVLDVTKSEGGFMTIIQDIVKKAQIIAFFVAVGIIVWLGLLMVLPANAEAKEATKGKLISVLLGFLAMISATIIINIVINLIYDIFSSQ